MTSSGRAAFFFYDGMADFEISFLIALCREFESKKEIVTIGTTTEPLKSRYGITFVPDAAISQVSSDEIDALIIPGGLSTTNPTELTGLIRQLDREEKILAAICMGPLFLARAGVLNGRRYTTTATPEALKSMNIADPFPDTGYSNEPLVRDGHIITALDRAFVDFAAEVAMALGILEDQDARDGVASAYKNLG